MDTVDVRNHSKCFCVAVFLFDLHVFSAHKELFLTTCLTTYSNTYLYTQQPLGKAMFPKQISEVFIDPDYTRGGEAERCQKIMVDLWKHWRSATVVITYPIGHWMTGGVFGSPCVFFSNP